MSTFNYTYPKYTKVLAQNPELTIVDEESTEKAVNILKNVQLSEDDSKSESEKSTDPDLKNVSASNINEQLSVTVTLDEYSKYLTEIIVSTNISQNIGILEKALNNNAFNTKKKC